MHCLARATFSLPFFFGFRLTPPPLPNRSKPERSVQRVPIPSARVTTSRPLADDLVKPGNGLTTRQGRPLEPGHATIVHLPPGSVDPRSAPARREPALREKTSDSAAGSTDSAGPSRPGSKKLFEQEFPAGSQFLELSIDREGTLQPGAGADRTLRSNPAGVRAMLEGAFNEEIVARCGKLDEKALGEHWKKALGVHSGAGNQCRPVLVLHMNLLGQYLKDLPPVTPGQ